MTDRPDSTAEWATDGINIVEPTPTKRAKGWLPGEGPPAQFFNWWKHLVGEWLKYLDEQIAAINPSAYAKLHEPNTFDKTQTIDVTDAGAPLLRSSRTASDDSHDDNDWMHVQEWGNTRMYQGRNSGALTGGFAFVYNARWVPGSPKGHWEAVNTTHRAMLLSLNYSTLYYTAVKAVAAGGPATWETWPDFTSSEFGDLFVGRDVRVAAGLFAKALTITDQANVNGPLYAEEAEFTDGVSCTHLAAGGNVSCQDVNAAGSVECAEVNASGDVSGASVHATANVSAFNLVECTNGNVIAPNGDVFAGGNAVAAGAFLYDTAKDREEEIDLELAKADPASWRFEGDRWRAIAGASYDLSVPIKLPQGAILLGIDVLHRMQTSSPSFFTLYVRTSDWGVEAAPPVPATYTDDGTLNAPGWHETRIENELPVVSGTRQLSIMAQRRYALLWVPGSHDPSTGDHLARVRVRWKDPGPR